MIGTTIGDVDVIPLGLYDGLGLGLSEGSNDETTVGNFEGLLLGS